MTSHPCRYLAVSCRYLAVLVHPSRYLAVSASTKVGNILHLHTKSEFRSCLTFLPQMAPSKEEFVPEQSRQMLCALVKSRQLVIKEEALLGKLQANYNVIVLTPHPGLIQHQIT